MMKYNDCALYTSMAQFKSYLFYDSYIFINNFRLTEYELLLYRISDRNVDAYFGWLK